VSEFESGNEIFGAPRTESTDKDAGKDMRQDAMPTKVDIDGVKPESVIDEAVPVDMNTAQQNTDVDMDTHTAGHAQLSNGEIAEDKLVDDVVHDVKELSINADKDSVASPVEKQEMKEIHQDNVSTELVVESEIGIKHDLDQDDVQGGQDAERNLNDEDEIVHIDIGFSDSEGLGGPNLAGGKENEPLTPSQVCLTMYFFFFCAASDSACFYRSSWNPRLCYRILVRSRMVLQMKALRFSMNF
jgi:hypothetical protein